MSNGESGASLRAFVVSQKIAPKDLAEALCISPQALNNWFTRGVPEERADDVRGAAAALAMHVPFNQLRNLLGELYQILGAHEAGAKVLDQVSAAIHGQPLPHETLLPYCAADPGFNFEEPPRFGLLNGISVMDGGPVLPARTIVASHDVFLTLQEKNAKPSDEGSPQ